MKYRDSFLFIFFYLSLFPYVFGQDPSMCLKPGIANPRLISSLPKLKRIIEGELDEDELVRKKSDIDEDGLTRPPSRPSSTGEEPVAETLGAGGSPSPSKPGGAGGGTSPAGGSFGVIGTKNEPFTPVLTVPVTTTGGVN